MKNRYTFKEVEELLKKIDMTVWKSNSSDPEMKYYCRDKFGNQTCHYKNLKQIINRYNLDYNMNFIRS